MGVVADQQIKPIAVKEKARRRSDKRITKLVPLAPEVQQHMDSTLCLNLARALMRKAA